MPLFEVVGKALKVAPEQMAATAVNVGVTFGLTVKLLVADVVPHEPPLVVNVRVTLAAELDDAV